MSLELILTILFTISGSYAIDSIGNLILYIKILKKIKKEPNASNINKNDLLLYFSSLYNVNQSVFDHIIPVYNIVKAIKKLTSVKTILNSYDLHLKIYNIITDNEPAEEVKTVEEIIEEVKETEEIKRDEYFVRFTRNNKFNSIFFYEISGYFYIIESNGEVSKLSEEEQLKIVDKILTDLKNGYDNDYGYSKNIFDLLKKLEIIQDVKTALELTLGKPLELKRTKKNKK